MSPPNAKRDDLVALFNGRLTRIEDHIRVLTELVSGRLTSIESEVAHREKRSLEWFDRTWPEHQAEHKDMRGRVSELEAVRQRGEGAMKAGQLIWAAAVAAAAGAGWVIHWLQTAPLPR